MTPPTQALLDAPDKLPQIKPELVLVNTEWRPEEAYYRYVHLGTDDFLGHDEDFLHQIRASLDPDRISHSIAAGWIGFELGMLDEAETSWIRAWELNEIIRKNEPYNGNIVESYRALTALAAVPMFRDTEFGFNKRQTDYYRTLAGISEQLLDEVIGRQYREPGLDHLAGFTQEFTVLMAIARLKQQHDLPLQALLAPPRQESPMPDSFPRNAWDVNVFQSDIGKIEHLQVKNRVRSADRRRYDDSLRLICGYRTLDNLTNYDGLQFPFLENLTAEAQGRTYDQELIDKSSAKLLDSIGRQDLIIKLPEAAFSA